MEIDSMPPYDYREINICPEATELVEDHMPFLRKNIVFGKYDGIEHYLDVQFRLLREDFIVSLRDNIIEYIRNRNESKAIKMDKKSCVYKNVQIKRKGALFTCKFDFTDWKVQI